MAENSRQETFLFLDLCTRVNNMLCEDSHHNGAHALFLREYREYSLN